MGAKETMEQLRKFMFDTHVQAGDVAAALGTSRTTVIRWIDGSMVPRTDKLVAIAEYMSRERERLATEQAARDAAKPEPLPPFLRAVVDKFGLPPRDPAVFGRYQERVFHEGIEPVPGFDTTSVVVEWEEHGRYLRVSDDNGKEIRVAADRIYSSPAK